jgi:hypothetical protein
MVKKGMEAFAKRFYENREAIMEWMGSPLFKELIFREIPIGTSTWAELRFKSAKEITENFLLKDKRIISNSKLPAILLANNRIAEGLSQGLIPIFFGYLQDQKIYDSSGKPLTATEKDFLAKDIQQKDIGENFKAEESAYFHTGLPLTIISEKLKILSSSETAFDAKIDFLMKTNFPHKKYCII